MSLHFMRYIVN